MNKVVIPVDVSNKLKTYRKSTGFDNKISLEKELIKRGLNIVLKKSLKGGFISQVYSAELNKKKVVVKHTEDLIPFDPTELYLPRESHMVDARIRRELQTSQTIIVPKVIIEYPDIAVSVMEDLSDEGFYLLSDKIIEYQVDFSSALKIGMMLANLAKESRKWENLPEVQTTEMSIYERGLELRLAYPNTQFQYLNLEKIFITNAKFWSWPDAHPKNIFIKNDGSCAFIDFGFSQKGDQRFMIATFLAHIVLYGLSGYIKSDLVLKFMKNCIMGFRSIEDKFEEEIFCKYLALEILHRANGKWIKGIEKAEQKVRCELFGMKIFDNNVTTLEEIFNLFKEITNLKLDSS